MANILYSKKEIERLKELWKEGLTRREIALVLNKEFWKGRSVRSENGVDRRLDRMRVDGSIGYRYGNPREGEFSPKHQTIWNLHKSGIRNTVIANRLGIPLSTVKSTVAYIRNNAPVALEALKEQTPDARYNLPEYDLVMKENEELKKQMVEIKTFDKVMMSYIKSNVDKLAIRPPVIRPHLKFKGTHNPEVAVLSISDAHIGQEVLKEDMAVPIEYNFNIFVERVQRLYEGVMEIMEIQRHSVPIKRLIVNFLGDIVTGESIFPFQQGEIDKKAIDQVFEGCRIFGDKLLYPLSKEFENIECYCFPGDTSITMFNLEKKDISKVVVGDKVISHNSHVKTVTDKGERYVDHIIRIKTGNTLKEIECTEEHPFYAVRHEDMLCTYKSHAAKNMHCWLNEKEIKYFPCDRCKKRPEVKPSFIKASELKCGDFLLMPTTEGIDLGIDSIKSDDRIFYGLKLERKGGKFRFHNMNGPRGRNKNDFLGNFKLNRNNMEALGWWTAEGHLVKSTNKNINGIAFSIGLHEKDFLKEIVGWCRGLGIEDRSIRIHENRKGNSIQIFIKNVALGHIFNFLCGSGASTKKLNSLVLGQRADVLRYFLKGCIRGDGCYVKTTKGDRIVYVTSSRELLENLQMIAMRCGLITSVSVREAGRSVYQGRVVNHKKAYYLSIYKSNGYGKSKFWNGFYIVPITDVNKVNKKVKVYNIEVDEDNSYVANGFAVHNCVYGNHGRVSRPGEFHQKTNFDYILYQLLANRFHLFNHIKFYISDTGLLLYKIQEAPKFTHLLTHGDEVRGWMQLPLYGMERTHNRYIQLTGVFINYIYSGHWHNQAVIDIPYGERIINGTFSGGSAWSLKRLQAISQPQQMFFGFNNRYGKTWEYGIKLAEMPEMKPNEAGIYTPYCTGVDERIKPYAKEE